MLANLTNYWIISIGKYFLFSFDFIVSVLPRLFSLFFYALFSQTVSDGEGLNIRHKKYCAGVPTFAIEMFFNYNSIAYPPYQKPRKMLPMEASAGSEGRAAPFAPRSLRRAGGSDDFRILARLAAGGSDDFTSGAILCRGRAEKRVFSGLFSFMQSQDKRHRDA